MATKSYLDVAISGTIDKNVGQLLLQLPENAEQFPEYVDTPYNLTLHEVVFTIHYAGKIIRKIIRDNYETTIACVNNIRSFITEIIHECKYLQPTQSSCPELLIFTPCLWYWAIANNDDTLKIQKFEDIYPNENYLLNSFLENSSPFVTPPCPSFHLLLQTLEKCYKIVSLTNANIIEQRYIMYCQVLEWRKHKNQMTEDQKIENEMHTKMWLIYNKTKLVKVPELPSNWVDKDPITRPVVFNAHNVQQTAAEVPSSRLFNAHSVQQATAKVPKIIFNSNCKLSSARIILQLPNVDPETVKTARKVQQAAVEVLYEPSANLRWHDIIKNKTTTVIIARNKNTNILEISEQDFNPLLQYLTKVIV